MPEIIQNTNVYADYDGTLSKYRFRKVPLNASGSGSTVTFQQSSSVLMEFKLPSREVFNLSKSFITYNYTIPAPADATYFNASLENGMDFCNFMSFGDGSGLNLAEINYVDRYVNTVRPLRTEMKEYLSNDISQIMYPVANAPNPLKNYLPYSIDGTKLDTTAYGPASAANNQTQVPITNTGLANTITNTGASYDGTPLPYDFKYVNNTPLVNSALSVTRQLPLSAFVDTIVGMDKNLIFSKEMYLRFQSQFTNRMVYTFVQDSTNLPSRPNGTAGTSNAVNAKPALEYASSIDVKNIFLYLAVEQNDRIKNSLTGQLDSGKFVIHIPFTTTYRAGSTGSQFTCNITLPRGIGQKLKRVLTTFYNSNEKINTTYDHSNFNGTKVSYIQTSINSAPLTDYKIGCYNPNLIKAANFSTFLELDKITGLNSNIIADDYREMKKYLVGTPIVNQMMYQNNWFYCDSFGLLTKNQDTQMLVHDINIDDGLDLTKGDYIYTVQADTPILGAGLPSWTNIYGPATYANGTQIFGYIFTMCRRSVLINHDGIMFL